MELINAGYDQVLPSSWVKDHHVFILFLFSYLYSYFFTIVAYVRVHAGLCLRRTRQQEARTAETFTKPAHTCLVNSPYTMLFILYKLAGTQPGHPSL